MMSWLVAFVWTLILEYPVYAAGVGRAARCWWEPLAWTLAVNVATHPLFSWWVLSRAPHDDEVRIAEVAIALAEGLLLALILRARCPPPRVLLTAIVANAGSYLVGGWLLAALSR
jgi:hypothetical protein